MLLQPFNYLVLASIEAVAREGANSGDDVKVLKPVGQIRKKRTTRFVVNIIRHHLPCGKEVESGSLTSIETKLASKKVVVENEERCRQCSSSEIGQWRRGPYGPHTLCNKCGLFYSKVTKRFGSRSANMLMRYHREMSIEDRHVPQKCSIPMDFVERLLADEQLDPNFFPILPVSIN
ncbi:hypothetical protein NCAS_0C04570 [Naumovozyma castellii]|uniref:GATA-type domain-containing protein n=1 Tax=Naumovozyma castellii TaxID=27288 RepID=G0VD85_NAUCA|nr:hypothetical protein NCAS_0C04570 [Naumovozyma castellii CBS 4309]CCC69447.1 hypothetical protein NCAS_0C04570 [Naumovozyma castellii CBS 4309]